MIETRFTVDVIRQDPKLFKTMIETCDSNAAKTYADDDNFYQREELVGGHAWHTYALEGIKTSRLKTSQLAPWRAMVVKRVMMEFVGWSSRL